MGMGGTFSSSTTTTTTPPKPTDSPNPNMSSSDPKTPESDSPTQPDQSSNKEIKNGDQQQQQQPEAKEKEKEKEKEEEEEEEEEEGECGFCLFMKGGGCKDAFIDWEKCIEEAEKKKEEIVVKCFDVTSALKKCMEAHSDYYEPILRAEKMAEQEYEKEMNDSKDKPQQDSDNKSTN